MRRIFACLAFLPLLLFGFETVNLIKDASFEKDSELWQAYAGGDGDQDSAVADRHDPMKAHSGFYSASCDTRTVAGEYWPAYEDSAVVIRGFSSTKIISDLDSLSVIYCVFPYLDNITAAGVAYISLYLNAGEDISWVAGYQLKRPNQLQLLSPSRVILGVIEFSPDTFWDSLSKPIRNDLEGKGIPSSAKVDSVVLMGQGGYGPPWRGQKIYWDDVRLMGYADYDVGVKEILSGDSLRQGHPYIPEARIKNFGREPADSFLVIAEIEDSTTIAYIDTVPWSLESDTEDTVSFAEFDPDYGPYTLRVRTVMEPDESDADDELSKSLFYLGITEPVKPVTQLINLEIHSLIHPLRISYSLPYTEPGTLTLYDATGRRVEQMSVKGSGEVLFSSSLPSGVYLVRLQTKQTAVTRKAVVLR